MNPSPFLGNGPDGLLIPEAIAEVITAKTFKTWYECKRN